MNLPARQLPPGRSVRPSRPQRPLLRRIAALLPALAVLLAAPSMLEARIIGGVVQAGFKVREGAACRTGEWLPILVELRAEGGETFSGVLRVEQKDTDGDRCAVETPVALSPDSPEPRRFWLYVPADLSDSKEVAVRLFDDDGNVTPVVATDGTIVDRMMGPYEPFDLDTEATLILDISEQTVPGLDRIETSGEKPFIYPPEVATCPPVQLPDRAYGLSMADTIVWNRPDVSPMSPDQVSALRTWVREGGTLVISAAQPLDPARIAGLETLMPVEVKEALPVRRFDSRLSNFLGGKVPERLLEPIYAGRLEPKPNAVVVESFNPDPPADPAETPAPDAMTPLIVRGRYGLGEVVVVAFDLSTLSRIQDADQTAIYKRLLKLHRFPNPPLQNFGFGRIDLFDYLRTAIGFGGLSIAYLLFAFLFIVLYILGSTVATWHVLARRGWSQHNWSVFAVAAIVGSVISVTFVQAIRGISSAEAQISIIDGVAGTSEARARCYFGLKTATHSLIDLWLPSDIAVDDRDATTTCKLEPISPSLEALQDPFANPHRYYALPERSRLEDVLMRATLKQFAGQWYGDTEGMVSGDIVTRGAVPTSGSWIQNDLPTDLENCQLLIASLDFSGSLRELNTYDFDLGRIKAGERIDLQKRILERSRNLNDKGELDLPKTSLSNRMSDWTRPFSLIGGLTSGMNQANRNADTFEDVVMLLSVLSELPPRTSQHTNAVDFARSRCYGLDLSNNLTDRQAYLIGFTRASGPVRLGLRSAGSDRDFRPVNPRSARTVYRIAIPVTPAAPGRAANAAAATDEDAGDS